MYVSRSVAASPLICIQSQYIKGHGLYCCQNTLDIFFTGFDTYSTEISKASAIVSHTSLTLLPSYQSPERNVVTNMKLQLLTLITITSAVTALPQLLATDAHEKRAVTQCTAKTLGQPCELLDSSGIDFTGTCRQVSLVYRCTMFTTIISLMTDPVC